MLLLALALQVAADTPERFSILVPVASQPCAREARQDGAAAGGDIVICGRNLPDQKLPLPTEAVSPLPQPVNRDRTGTGALAAEATPCAARIGGCQVGVDLFGAGTALIRGVQKLIAPNSCCEEPGEAKDTGKLVRDVAGLFKGKPNKSNRVAIVLDDKATEGKVLP